MPDQDLNKKAQELEKQQDAAAGTALQAADPADDDEYEYVEVEDDAAADDAEDADFEDGAAAEDDDAYEYVEEDEDDDDDEYEYVEVEDDAADADGDDDDDDEYEYVEVDENGNEIQAQSSTALAAAGAAAAVAEGAAAASSAGAAAGGAQPEKELTEEEKAAQAKAEKNRRIRRNLRILALVVACYYFISAGYTWWQEREHEGAQEGSEIAASSELSDAFANPQIFRDRFNASINEQRSSLPTANANDSTSGFVAVLSPAVELRGVVDEESQATLYMQLQTRYPDALPPESLTALRAFVCACENTLDAAKADEILNSLGIIPETDANEAGKVFEAAQIQTEHARYELSFTDDAIDELTLKAFPR